jgi:TIR domain
MTNNYQDYQYDVFLSYPVHSLAGEWVRNHFLPVLKEELDAQTPNPRLFCWTENEVGVIWDKKLEIAHATSKVMVAVLTPPYFFQSRWCPIEWHTMVERERIAQLGLELDWTDSLICPVLFSDGSNLPVGARRVTSLDFRDWAFPEPVFRQTPEFIRFRRKVRELAEMIVSNRLLIAPRWSRGWPVIHSPALARPHATKPTFAE